ncbi:hypothetical protein TTHERM_00600740 (macronuclear) [Tetrahymena thermophila SB210]|uniref:Uncharacterized protein n=1 Tax=Tetrahymena thermophila (strain SB210) TaxID=312017 RepID=I7LZT4_TETTS|nr:hypothetical protein TTHERM_00600740 [Tetrahymena thermophila SB210]EAR84882.2 hypothetical protein TTHERM_00600740 [Tetrahymena thermophila SB210]|eukprot:XP_001032545.2 hypothetical protein TTHERM_00600740 [Tetrahymena thermophila SB210]
MNGNYYIRQVLMVNQDDLQLESQENFNSNQQITLYKAYLIDYFLYFYNFHQFYQISNHSKVFMNKGLVSQLDEKVFIKTASNNFANKSMKKFNLYAKPVKNNKSSFHIDLSSDNQKSKLNSSYDNQRNNESLKRNTRYSSIDRHTPQNQKEEQNVNKENLLSQLSKRKPRPISILDQLQNLPVSGGSTRSYQANDQLKQTPRTQMIVCNQCKETMPRELFFKHYDKDCKGFRGYSNYTPQNVRESLKDIFQNNSFNKLEKPLDLLELKKQKLIQSIDKRRSSASYHQENQVDLQEGKIVYKANTDKKCCPFCEIFIKVEKFEEHINECRLFSIVDNLKQGYLDKSESNTSVQIGSRPPTQSKENRRNYSKPQSSLSGGESDYLEATNQFKQIRQAKSLVKNRVKKNSKIEQQKQFNKVYDNYQDIIQKRISDISQLKRERDELRENNLKAIKSNLDILRIEIQDLKDQAAYEAFQHGHSHEYLQCGECEAILLKYNSLIKQKNQQMQELKQQQKDLIEQAKQQEIEDYMQKTQLKGNSVGDSSRSPSQKKQESFK